MAAAVMTAFIIAACGSDEDPNAPANLEIHDSYAGVY